MKNKETKISREGLYWLMDSPIEVKMELLNSHLSICQLIINQIFEDNQMLYAGGRYDREKPQEGKYSRWGYNNGSIRIGDEKVAVQVPRLVNQNTGETFNTPVYKELKKNHTGEQRIMAGMLQGLSTRNYQGVIDTATEAFGMSKSAISQRFVEQTSEKLEEFHSRKFAQKIFAGLMIDGIEMGGDMMIIALGITSQGEKIPLDFVHAASEHHRPIKMMLERIKSRGFKVEGGFIAIIDGSKGIAKAVKEVFGTTVIIQRCIWHKYNNVISYLPEKHHQWFKEQYYDAMEGSHYQAAKSALESLSKLLRPINENAANSLMEGVEELLSLHKIATVKKDQRMIKYMRISLATTNCIENLNSGIRRHFIRVDRWTNSNQRNRWLASALLNLESKMRKIKNAKKLPELIEGIKLYLKSLKSNRLSFS